MADSPSATHSAPRSALVLEDQPKTADWLASSIREAFPAADVVTAASISEAKQLLADGTAPDLALIDLGLPDGDGTQIIEALSATPCATVVTTTFADDEHVFGALQAGAQGYLLKDASRQELAQLLTGLVGGRPPLSPSIARRVLAHFSNQQFGKANRAVAGAETASTSADPSRDSDLQAVHLSRRESETLELIAKGFTVAKVSEALGISSNTTAGYVKSIYRKLNVSSRAEAATQANRLGLIS